MPKWGGRRPLHGGGGMRACAGGAQVDALRAAGQEPYAYSFQRTHTARDLQEQFKGLGDGEVHRPADICHLHCRHLQLGVASAILGPLWTPATRDGGFGSAVPAKWKCKQAAVRGECTLFLQGALQARYRTLWAFARQVA